ncbi:MAG: hypothetical protein LCH54_15675 [Bacteroidetes bacterium]|nr:hypothetical protein [Bacteroidota bacterium]
MKTMLTVLLVLATGTLSAQSFSELKKNHPGAFGSQAKKDNVTVYEKADVNTPTLRVLELNEFVLVYDSTDVFYYVAKQKDGAIGLVLKSGILNPSEVTRKLAANREIKAQAQGVPVVAPPSRYKVNGAGIAFALVSAGLAWDYGTKASEWGKTIDDEKKRGATDEQLKDYKKTQVRETILAIICGAGAVAGVILSIESVSIEPINKGVALNYTIKF